MKGQGVESYPCPVKEGQRYINLNPTLAPTTGRDNYHTSRQN